MDNDDATKWDLGDAQKEKPKRKKRKPGEKAASLAVHQSNYINDEALKVSNQKMGFPAEYGSSSDLMIMEIDMEGTVFARMAKNRFERTFPSGQILWYHILRYFEWVDNNPFQRAEVIKSGPQAGRIMSVPQKRPYTQKGLAIFLGISASMYKRYKEDPDLEDYNIYIQQAEEIIYNDQFEGAASGFYNPNVVSKNLGLTEKIEKTETIEGTYTIIGMQVI